MEAHLENILGHLGVRTGPKPEKTDRSENQKNLSWFGLGSKNIGPFFGFSDSRTGNRNEIIYFSGSRNRNRFVYLTLLLSIYIDHVDSIYTHNYAFVKAI